MPAAKKGLGRGLDSLIPAKSEAKSEASVNKDALEGAVMMDINKIEPNKDQPRKIFNEDELQELCESIKLHGIIDPLIVNKKNGYYEIIGGERRWRASKKVGLEKVPVIIKELTDQQVAEFSLIDNIQRKELNPIEEAAAYKRLITEFNLKQDEVAERVSKSRTAVANTMRLLNLDERVQQMVIENLITEGHAKPLLGIKDPEKQYIVAQQVFDEKLTAREAEKLVKNLQNKKKATEPEAKALNPQMEAVYRELQEQLKELLGTKVTINSKDAKSGKIEVEYYSQEELDRIIDLIRTIRK